MRSILVIFLVFVTTTFSVAAPPLVVPVPRFDSEGFTLPPRALARIGSARFRSDERICQILFTLDSKSVVTRGRKSLLVWDIATGCVTQRMDVGGESFNAALSPDGCAVVVLARTGDEAVCVVFELQTGQEVRRLRPGPRCELLLSPDGALLGVYKRAPTGPGPTLHLLDAVTHRHIRNARMCPPGLKSPEYHLAPGGHRLVTTDGTDGVTLYDTDTGLQLLSRGTDRYLEKWDSSSWSVAFSHDGNTLVVLESQDGNKIGCWDTQAATSREIRLVNKTRRPTEISFARDGKHVLLSDDDRVAIVELATGKETFQISANRGSGPVISPDEKLIALIEDCGLRIYDRATGRLLPQSPLPTPRRLLFRNDGQVLYGTEQQLVAWDVATQARQKTWASRSVDDPIPGDRYFTTPSPCGKYIAWSTHTGEIIIEDAATGREFRRLPDPEKNQPMYLRTPRDIYFSADGNRIITSGSIATPASHSLHIWGLTGDKPILTSRAADHLWETAISRNGERFAKLILNQIDGGVCSLDIEIWDMATEWQRVKFAHPGNDLLSLAISPDGNHLAAVLYDQNHARFVKIWNLDIGQSDHKVKSQHNWSRISYSPDGRNLLVTGSGPTVMLEAATGKERDRFLGANRVDSAVFSPDGRMFATSSADAPIYLWDFRGRLHHSPTRLSRAELDRYRALLAGPDARAALDAIRALAAAPDDTLSSFRKTIRDTYVDKATVQALIQDLASPIFATRKRATDTLETEAMVWAPTLRAAHAEEASPEARRRLETILAMADQPTGHILAAIRAVEAVEWIGTPEAAKLLHEWARDWGENLAGRDARAAAKRLQAK